MGVCRGQTRWYGRIIVFEKYYAALDSLLFFFSFFFALDAGVATPTNDILLALVRQIEAGEIRPCTDHFRKMAANILI